MNKQANPAFMGPGAVGASGKYRALRAAAAPSPAVAGFRPAGVALAVAACFMGATNAFGQPAGAQAVQGQALLQQQGNSLVVKTLNAPGTNRSVINWQSFSVPAGSTTRFDQPTVQSLSINRVLGNDPSSIFGTLSSNGRLVLVNPAGIAVGTGAVVDTAGFTASTLRMSDADALAGRLSFGDGTSAGGPLKVDGSIVARSGDVVLIAPNVQVGQQALVQAANGATLLAAGQKVELTGRGLEGIVMQVQAPDNQAVNLGTLQGDAVGVFAGTLRHSGLIQANAVSTDGGRVVLKAGGDALVDGVTLAKSGDKGGSVDVLGDRVALFGNASIDVSGAQGGGSVRIGGDLHGDNAAVPNASATFVGADARINADATQSGDGGRVIVWSDDTTRYWGQISARGAGGGNGGFAETSGKKQLDFQGGADLRAPGGKAGTLLLDPSNITITTGTSLGSTTSLGPGSPYYFTGTGAATNIVTNTQLQDQLANGNVVVQTSFAPFSDGGTPSITVAAPVAWATNTLVLQAGGSINVNSSMTAPTGQLIMTAVNGDIVQASNAGSIQVDKLVAQGTTVSLNSSAGNQIATLAASAGNLTVKNTSSLTIGTISSPLLGGSGMVDGVDAGGLANITSTTGNLIVNAPLKAANKVTLTSTNGSISSSSSGWVSGGSVLMNATNGGISLLGSVTTNGEVTATPSPGDGSVKMNAQSISFGSIHTSNMTSTNGVTGGLVALTATSGGISGGGIFTGGGSSSLGNGGTGGAVVLSATTSSGFINISQIDTQGGWGSTGAAGGNGGAVTVTTGSGLFISSIDASGRDGGDSGAAEPGGNGGIVSINSTGGNTVSLGNARSEGGDGYGGGKGGNGGTIKITAANGSIGVNSGSLSTAGGYGYDGGSGGNGGPVNLTANQMYVYEIKTSGGSGGFGSGSGGNAGPVTIVAGNYAYVDSIYGYGGDADGTGNAGTGATVSMTSTSGASLGIGWADLTGGSTWSGTGGNGGSLTMTTSGTVWMSNAAMTDGGYVTSLGAGGTGGNITLSGGAVFTPIYVSASGGKGGDNGIGTAGVGGNAGNVKIEQTAGDWAVSYVSIGAGGGQGGYGLSAQAAGGTGGSVSLGAKAGALTLSSGDLGASGGYSADAPGTHGTVRVTATGTAGVTVTGLVDFSGNWVNAGILNMDSSAGISGGGTFTNAGTGKLFMTGNADLFANGGVLNQSGGTISAATGNMFANITNNASGGLVTVASDASLDTGSMQNDGTLNVFGTLYASGGCALTANLCAATVNGLVNGTSGVINGNGTIVTNLLDSFGTISPGTGSAHTVGILSVDGDLVLEPNSKLFIDIASASSYDQLSVSGYTSLSPLSKSGPSAAVLNPPTISISFGSGATFVAGDTFNIINSAGGIDTSVTPNIAGTSGELTVVAPSPTSAPTALTLVAATAFPPPAPPPPPEPPPTVAPTSPPATTPPATSPPATSPPATSPPATSPPATSPPATSPPVTSPPATSPPPPPPPPPAPSSGTPLVDKIVELLDGDHDAAAQVVAQLDTNPLTTFTTLVLKEEKKQTDQGSPNVVANVCSK